MADRSGIAWTQATWNPVTGCDRISSGCAHCFAASMAARLKAMGSPRYQRDGDPRTSGPGFAVTVHPSVLDQPTRWIKPRLIFVNSMSDLFHARVPASFVRDVFEVMSATPRHTYQVLTKRPLRAVRMAEKLPWPPNVWVGTSVENSDVLHRIDHLRQVPAALRFLSCEPHIGPLGDIDLDGIGWVIAGGESGPGHRPMDPAWVRTLRDQATGNGVPFFFKQWAATRPKALGRELDGRTWEQMPTDPPASTRGTGRDPATRAAS